MAPTTTRFTRLGILIAFVLGGCASPPGSVPAAYPGDSQLRVNATYDAPPTGGFSMGGTPISQGFPSGGISMDSTPISQGFPTGDTSMSHGPTSGMGPYSQLPSSSYGHGVSVQVV